MKKVVKITGIILGVIIGLLLIIILISFTNHKMQLSKESSMFIPNGEIVEVDGHEMHIYTEGRGDDTLVFLSGGGTCSPVLDFKSLYSLFSKEYKVVVVEKSGYGFSEDANVSRDIDTILDETRKALTKLGLEGPYILFPHSMSGIEALYWAQEYPEEVKGIVGLDMAVPEAYEDYEINNFMLNLSSFGAKIGITRFFSSIANDSASIKYGSLTEKERDLYRIIFYRRTLTKSMFREINEIKENAKKVKENGRPQVPILFFISNGHGTGWDEDKWVEIQESYIETVNQGKGINLDCEHYIHDIEYERIAKESKVFIEEILNR